MNVNMKFSRRSFLKSATLAPLCAASGIPLNGTNTMAMEPIKREGGPKLKIALNAYSFARPLNDHLRGRGAGITLLDLLDFCVKYDFDALDATGYYFPGYGSIREGTKGIPTDQYVFDLKRRAFELGIEISGTGVQNDFATPDKEKRAADVRHVKQWVEVAAKLGAPVLRIFAGPIPEGYEKKWDEVAAWMTADFKTCADYAAKYGVMIGVQNHGDMLQTADQVIKVIKMVNSPWFGAINDTGYYVSKDPYDDMARVLPYTVNWQIKERLGGKDGKAPMDLKKLIGLIKAGGYRGYIPIETLSERSGGGGKQAKAEKVVAKNPSDSSPVYDPFERVPVFLKQVRQALAETA
jgi:sugar phosphate isomerase/epimerase